MSEQLYGGLTEAEMNELADILTQKVATILALLEPPKDQEALREMVGQVVLDTLLTADGTITMEGWRQP